MKNKKGFTLVELLAVIVILAVILVIAVPQIINTIDEARNGAFISSAKLIAASAETAKLANDTLGITDNISCEDVSEYNSEDYESCMITFDENGEAQVTLVGKGKFQGKYICNGTRTIETVTESVCLVKATTKVSSLVNSEGSNGVIEANGIRYVGATPNNYVYYNCDDEDTAGIEYGEEDYNYASSCEKWRIVGVFDVSNGTKTESRVKLIRDASIGSMSWDSSVGGEGIENSINFGYGVNEWSEADLKVMLNTYYIGESDSCKYCNGGNQATCENVCTSSVKQISDTSLAMIEDAVWYTGAKEWVDEMPVDAIYEGERGTQNGKICTGTTYEGGKYCTDTVERRVDWKGKVGLIYPSDYGYASRHEDCASDIVGEDSTCENDNWLHPSSGNYWTISPRADSGDAYVVWSVGSSSSVINVNAHDALAVRPSVYLKSNIQIGEGKGTSNSPYVLYP